MEYSSSEECLTKKKKSKSKKRFSDDQIRSLEVMFECDTKLEPKKKLQLARELGLQPRQVAIWFQNKRARWKSKHIEKEYADLLSNYNNLASQFEILKKEKQSLLSQLEKAKHDDNDKNGDGDEAKTEFEGNFGCTLSDEDSCCIKPELMGLDGENEFLRISDHDQVWDCDDDDMMMKQTSDDSSEWWDFWS